MASLVDLFYPDNKNRLDRLNGLIADCGAYQRVVTGQKIEYDDLIKTVNERIKEVFPDFKESDWTEVKLPDGTVIGRVFAGLSSIFVGGASVYGLNAAWKAWMLQQGRIGEAALVKLLGYPTWFKFARAGAFVAITFALDSIITAIIGAEQREQLRQGIHDCIAPRMNIFKAFKYNQILLDELKVVNSLLELEYIDEPDKIRHAIDKSAKKAKAKIDALTDDVIRKDLEKIDQENNAWTQEDHIKDYALVETPVWEEAPAHYLDGSLVAAEKSETIYLIMNGKRCLVPNMTVFATLFASPESVHRMDLAFFKSIPEGEPLSESACLMKCEEDEDIYFYSNSAKRLIRSIGEFNQAGFTREKILMITKAQADNIKSMGEFIVADW